MRTELTDSQCLRILDRHPTVPKTDDVFELMRALYRHGRDCDTMKVAYKKPKETK